MVPGSTLMYGSSLRTDTARPRALRSRPTLAAVMPLPREEVTPPVTKTYFAIARFSSGGFSNDRDGRGSPQTVPENGPGNRAERRAPTRGVEAYSEGRTTTFSPVRAAAAAKAASTSRIG